MTNETLITGPRPYRIDNLIHKVETLDTNGDDKYLFRHDFKRLDATNVSLLLEREKNTKRVTEKMTKGRTRNKVNQDDADKTFYSALVTGGGWMPHGLVSYQDKGLIPPSMAKFYTVDGEGVWQPTWVELDKETMMGLTPEKMGEAIDSWLQCKGKGVSSGTIDFMFEKGGLMRIGLGIGDFDNPAYKLLLEVRRPDSKRRTRFKEDFAYAVDHSKGGELGKVETIIDLRQGISFFDEYFATIVDDPAYSQVLFEDKRAISEGRDPKPISAVPVENEPEPEIQVRPYSDDLRTEFITLFNPSFKVEVAAAAIQVFSKTDQE